MSMSRDPGSDLVPGEPRPSSFTLTVDHWLIIGPIVAAVFVVAGLLLMS
jgi:hypothetical protein